MNFKKCYPLTDRTKSRDAVASKKENYKALLELAIVLFRSATQCLLLLLILLSFFTSNPIWWSECLTDIGIM